MMSRMAILLALFGATAAALPAQDLEYTSTTQMKGSPALGPMMTGPRALAAKVFLKGARLRIEMGTGATIVDVARKQVTALDQARRMYTALSFDGVRQPKLDSPPPVAVSVTSRGDRTTIIARVQARNPNAPQATDALVVTEIRSKPSAAYDRIADAAQAFGMSGDMLMPLFAQDPRAGAALQKAGEAAAKVHGLPLRRSNVYGLIPAGKKFSPGTQLDTMMSVVTEITNVKSVNLPAKLFEVPAGYTKMQR